METQASTGKTIVLVVLGCYRIFAKSEREGGGGVGKTSPLSSPIVRVDDRVGAVEL